MNEDNRKKHLIIDKLLGVIAISIMAVVLFYIILAPKIHHSNALVPAQWFLFTAYYLLTVVLIIYFVVFIIKIVTFIRDRELAFRFSTPLVFDLIVILVGVLFLSLI